MSRLLSDATPASRWQLSSPGALYNFGNLLGLLAGLAVSVAGATFAVNAANSIADLTIGYFIGNRAALLTTVATIIFFASGNAYDRGLASGQGPFRGDLLSGVGAMVLGAALMALGSPILAATSGLLHDAGKFGSAAAARGPHATRQTVRLDLFRWAVLASRAPGLIVAASQIFEQTLNNTRPLNFVLPATMLACYSLWSLADITLLQPWSRPSSQAVLRRL